MIRPKKKLHLATESVRVLNADALRRAQGGAIDRCSEVYSGCNPGQTNDCTLMAGCDASAVKGACG
jgi:hypothetical protein